MIKVLAICAFAAYPSGKDWRTMETQYVFVGPHRCYSEVVTGKGDAEFSVELDKKLRELEEKMEAEN